MEAINKALYLANQLPATQTSNGREHTMIYVYPELRKNSQIAKILTPGDAKKMTDAFGGKKELHLATGERSVYNYTRNLMIVIFVKRGIPNETVAEIFGVNPKTVRNQVYENDLKSHANIIIKAIEEIKKDNPRFRESDNQLIEGLKNKDPGAMADMRRRIEQAKKHDWDDRLLVEDFFEGLINDNQDFAELWNEITEHIFNNDQLMTRLEIEAIEETKKVDPYFKELMDKAGEERSPNKELLDKINKELDNNFAFYTFYTNKVISEIFNRYPGMVIYKNLFDALIRERNLSENRILSELSKARE